jgi:hypothetical protein
MPTDAIHAAAEQIPGRHSRSRWRAWTPGLVVVGVLSMIALTSLFMARSSAIATAREIVRELEEDALEQAASRPGPPRSP